MKIKVDGKIIESVDCLRWGLEGSMPACTLGLDLNQCSTCPSRVARPAQPVRVQPTTMVNKAASWMKAEISRITKEMAPGEYEARIEACTSCSSLLPEQAPLVGYCKACGCGKNPRSELTVKGKMPDAKCPAGKWPVTP